MSVDNSSTKRRATVVNLLSFALLCSCFFLLALVAFICSPSPAFLSFNLVYSPLFLFARLCSPLLSFSRVCLEISLGQFKCKYTFDSETIAMQCERVSISFFLAPFACLPFQVVVVAVVLVVVKSSSSSSIRRCSSRSAIDGSP